MLKIDQSAVSVFLKACRDIKRRLEKVGIETEKVKP